MIKEVLITAKTIYCGRTKKDNSNNITEVSNTFYTGISYLLSEGTDDRHRMPWTFFPDGLMTDSGVYKYVYDAEEDGDYGHCREKTAEEIAEEEENPVTDLDYLCMFMKSIVTETEAPDALWAMMLSRGYADQAFYIAAHDAGLMSDDFYSEQGWINHLNGPTPSY